MIVKESIKLISSNTLVLKLLNWLYLVGVVLTRVWSSVIRSLLKTQPKRIVISILYRLVFLISKILVFV